MDALKKEVYDDCIKQIDLPANEVVNHVKRIYDSFSVEQVSAKMAQMLKPKDINAEVEIIFQTVEDLHKAIPDHLGDWYFTGNYPPPEEIKW